MKPIGLRYKNPELNPYTGRITGELMIVHQCNGCNHISSNRVAGDDNPIEIVHLLHATNEKGAPVNLNLLTGEDKNEVLSSLYGYNFQQYVE